jgi:hypothetical protein
MQPATAFSGLAPVVPAQRRAPRARTCRTRPAPTACAHAPNAAKNPSPVEDELHPSWGVYERPGNQCVICDGMGKCKCLYCFGDGVVFVGPQKDRDGVVCPQCMGATAETCARCAGTGVRPNTRLDPRTMKQVANRTNQDVLDGVNEPEGRMFDVDNGAGGDTLDVGTDGKEIPEEAIADAR